MFKRWQPNDLSRGEVRGSGRRSEALLIGRIARTRRLLLASAASIAAAAALVGCSSTAPIDPPTLPTDASITYDAR